VKFNFAIEKSKRKWYYNVGKSAALKSCTLSCENFVNVIKEKGDFI